MRLRPVFLTTSLFTVLGVLVPTSGHAEAPAPDQRASLKLSSDSDGSAGLALYLDAYLAQEDRGDTAARDFRRNVGLRHAIDPSSDSVVADDEVAMAFHQLRRRLGDDRFFSGLRQLAERFGSKRASWRDIEKALTQGSADAKGLLSEWTERPGLPRLRLTSLSQRPEGTLVGVVQDGPVHDLDLELGVTFTDGTTLQQPFRMTQETMDVVIESERPVQRVVLDPDWQVPVSLRAQQQPPCLARTLASKRLICVPPEPGEDAQLVVKGTIERYRKLAERFAEEHGGEVISSLHLAQGELDSASVVLFGNRDLNRWVHELGPEFEKQGYDILSPDRFRAGTRVWKQPGDALLATIDHPALDGATLSVFVANSEAGLSASEHLLTHGLDSWIAFRDGNALERAQAWPEDELRELRRSDAGPVAAQQRLMATVEALVGPEMEGRLSGSGGNLRAVQHVVDSFQELRLQPVDDRDHHRSFFFVSHNLPRSGVLFRRPTPGVAYQRHMLLPASFSLPIPEKLTQVTGSAMTRLPPADQPIIAPFPKGVVHVGTIDSPAWEGVDLEESLAIILDTWAPPTDPDERERAENERTPVYLELLPEVRRRNGAHLVVIRTGVEAPGFAPLTSYPSLSAVSDPRAQRLLEEEGRLGVARWCAQLAAHAPEPSADVGLHFAGASTAAGLAEAGLREPGDRIFTDGTMDLRFRITAMRLDDRNLKAQVPGDLPFNQGVVIVSAHHDGVGHSKDGTILQGASNNAAGVAVMLELARRLGESPAELGVIFISHGGAEWGQHGAKLEAQQWPKHWPIKALVNLDSIGRRDEPLHVIGRSREPALAELLERKAEEHGLVLGEDIDHRADRDGGDHWPWVERGHPAVTLSQATDLDGALDRIEGLDPAALESLTDALEAAVRELARPADEG
ncbi:MAG: M28 family peptidase [Acidobacteriota bacterium]